MGILLSFLFVPGNALGVIQLMLQGISSLRFAQRNGPGINTLVKRFSPNKNFLFSQKPSLSTVPRSRRRKSPLPIHPLVNRRPSTQGLPSSTRLAIRTPRILATTTTFETRTIGSLATELAAA